MESGLPQHLGAGDLVAGLALLELPEGLDAQLGGEREHPLVGVTDPLRAQLDLHPGHRFLGQDPAADPVVGLQDERLQAGPGHLPGRD